MVTRTKNEDGDDSQLDRYLGRSVGDLWAICG